MAFDPTPTELFAGYTAGSSDITIPLSAIPELTAAEADEVTGDSRKIIFALQQQIYEWYDGLATADRPAKVTVNRSDFSDPSAGTLTSTYVVQIVTNYSGQEVVDV